MRRTRDWSGLSAVIAALVGLLALCVSGYTAWLQRQQIRAQVWPYLEPAVSGSQHEAVLINKGIGPAIVHHMQVSVDGKLQKNWHEVFAALGLSPETPTSTVSGVVVAAGERIRQLVFASQEDFKAFRTQYPRLSMRICYCSTLNECWLLDQAEQNLSNPRREVAECPAASPDDFIDNQTK